jgi:hypothetical protein
VAAAVLPIIPAVRWQPVGGESPILTIVLMLTVTVGLPYLALVGTGPLLQVWFARLRPGQSPYRLYATSNAGSLLALLSYPFLVERVFTGREQAWVWSAVFVVVVCLVTVCAWLAARSGRGAATTRDMRRGDAGSGKQTADPATEPATEPAAQPASWITVLLWMGWAAVGVTVMMAVSLQLCQNIVTMPFLWVMPLAIYLLSFVIAFGGTRWYRRRVMVAALAAACVALYLVIPGHIGADGSVRVAFSPLQQLLVFSAALLVISLVCHGELYRLRPAPDRLTRFYLAIAAGGAVGGVFVGVIAPAALGPAQELYIGMAAVGILLLVTLYRDVAFPLYHGRPRWTWAAMVAAWFGLATMLWYQAQSLTAGALFWRRNFFGSVSVTLHDPELPNYRRLVMRHGITKHGAQYLQGTYQRLPGTYYSPFTGVGLAITAYGASLGRDTPMRVGVVGLGIGSLAAYGRPGDAYRFYEINPAVIELAWKRFDPGDPGDPGLRFTYLADCQAEVAIVLGDARLQLARELAADTAGHAFDILVLDAFDSGAIPLHLLTREAFALYASHLKPDGVLAVHISNKQFDLHAVVHRLAATQDFESLVMTNRRRDFKEMPDLDCDISNRAEWAILYRSLPFAEQLYELARPLIASEELRVESGAQLRVEPGRVWTDDYSNLFETLR